MCGASWRALHCRQAWLNGRWLCRSISVLETLSSRRENYAKWRLHRLKKETPSKLWRRYILQTKRNKNSFQMMCNKPLYITLSDMHKQIHQSHAAQAWQYLYRNLHTVHLCWYVCHWFKVSAAQLPKPNFTAQLKTDTLNLIIIKTEPNVFSMEDSFHLAGAESPVLYRKRFCVSLQDHCYKIGLGLSCWMQQAEITGIYNFKNITSLWLTQWNTF